MALEMFNRVKEWWTPGESEHDDLAEPAPEQPLEVTEGQRVPEPREPSPVTPRSKLAGMGDPRFKGAKDRRSSTDRRKKEPIRRWRMHRKFTEGEVVFIVDKPILDRRNPRRQDRRIPPLDTN